MASRKLTKKDFEQSINDEYSVCRRNCTTVLILMNRSSGVFSDYLRYKTKKDSPIKLGTWLRKYRPMFFKGAYKEWLDIYA